MNTSYVLLKINHACHNRKKPPQTKNLNYWWVLGQRQRKTYLIMLFFMVLKCEGSIKHNIKQLFLFDASGRTYSFHVAWRTESTKNLSITYIYTQALLYYYRISYIYYFCIIFNTAVYISCNKFLNCMVSAYHRNQIIESRIIHQERRKERKELNQQPCVLEMELVLLRMGRWSE